MVRYSACRFLRHYIATVYSWLFFANAFPSMYDKKLQMTSYPHKPFIKTFNEREQVADTKRKRQKQLNEVYKRRAVIFKIMQRMRGK
jgi:hypothetical protein